MRRSLGLVLTATTLMVISGCSSGGRIDGPVLVSPRPPLLGGGGMDAIVSGTLAFDGECLHLIQGGIEYPVVWPFGASWESDLPAVVVGGEVLEPGVTVTGGGGWLNRESVEFSAGASVANAAAECIGPTGEIAFFNIGSDVEVVID